MKIIAGLGNPGRDYEGTRHNVGFRVVDELARRHGLACDRKKFKSLFCVGGVCGEKCVLLKPQKYMNLSGDGVRPALDWYDCGADDLLVVCDDFHLPLGKLRIRRGGSSGGHKGLESIIVMLGTDQFSRLRIGIGEGGPGDKTGFVLSRFRAEEATMINEGVLRGADAVEMWIDDGVDATMNKFN
jgi:PTH1 family peptidyl-tRNA hydrolase